MLDGFKKMPILRGSAFVSIGYNSLNFNKNVVYRLPVEYVILLVNFDKKQLAIQKCNKSTEGKISFVQSELNRTNGVRLINKKMAKMLESLMQWDFEHYIYRANGFYFDDEQAMIFNLSQARKFTRRKSVQ